MKTLSKTQQRALELIKLAGGTVIGTHMQARSQTGGRAKVQVSAMKWETIKWRTLESLRDRGLLNSKVVGESQDRPSLGCITYYFLDVEFSLAEGSAP